MLFASAGGLEPYFCFDRSGGARLFLQVLDFCGPQPTGPRRDSDPQEHGSLLTAALSPY